MYKLIVFILFIFFINEAAGQKTPSTWGFGAELGAMNATIDAGYFAMGFSVDYRVGENFSIAELLTFIPTGDLFQMNLNTIARFEIPLNPFTLVPYLGIGFSYGRIEKLDESDRAVSIGFPIGASLNYPLAQQISASGRIGFTLYHMDYGSFGTDKSYVEVMFGLRFTP